MCDTFQKSSGFFCSIFVVVELSEFQKKFKRLKRMQIEDSDAEEDEGMDRENIARELFDGDEVIFARHFAI